MSNTKKGLYESKPEIVKLLTERLEHCYNETIEWTNTIIDEYEIEVCEADKIALISAVDLNTTAIAKLKVLLSVKVEDHDLSKDETTEDQIITIVALSRLLDKYIEFFVTNQLLNMASYDYALEKEIEYLRDKVFDFNRTFQHYQTKTVANSKN